MDEIVCVGTYFNEGEAELAKGLLEANGIVAMILSDTAGDMFPPFAEGGYRLCVQPADAEKAQELLPD